MTKIAPGKHVVIDYVLSDEDGETIQQSSDDDVGPLAYVHGYSPILPGLHKGLEGLSMGDKTKVSVSPEEGYGEADEDGIFEVDRTELPNPEGVQCGDEIIAEGEDGEEFTMHVVELHDDFVVVDTNHPLAGYTLIWDVSIRSVRDATSQEIETARTEAAELGDTLGES